MNPWISVKDRLPDENQVVDLWCYGERLTNYRLFRNYGGQEGNNFFDPIGDGVFCVREATHWMPVPDGPNGEKQTIGREDE